MNRYLCSTILIVFLINPILTQCETRLQGQPEYIPMLEGNHMDAYYPNVDASGRYTAFTTSFPLVQEHMDIVRVRSFHNTQVYVFDRQEKSYELISVQPDGKGLNYGFCMNVAMNSTGRFVGYCSFSYEVVPFDRTLKYGLQIYLRDRITNESHHITITPDGLPCDTHCWLYGISGDGRYVLFSTESAKFTENDTNDREDIFVYDRETKTATCHSMTADGRGTNARNVNASFSDDGRYVVFQSEATNWLSGEPAVFFSGEGKWYPVNQVILKDTQMDEITILTEDESGQLSPGYNHDQPRISADGRWIAFIYNVPLLPDLPEAWVYVYLYDRINRKLEMIHALNPEHQTYTDFYYTYFLYYKLLLSGDGRFLIWYQGLKEYDTLLIHRYDLKTKELTEIVYADYIPIQGFDPQDLFVSNKCSVNHDGSVFLFTTGSKELTPYYSQDPYIDLFGYPFSPSFRIVLLSMLSSSNTNGWSLFR